ncbi:MAG: hypothetical protein A2Z96_03860 [Spirochaetes bacterium GWB1_48_6]|nr:MAG: hypothetical protein A2Z96_03860 [Spirochaetes bacterium GWB1_48_6]
MNLRPKRRTVTDPIESGSLSDLAFLLIIYFIVIAGFNVNLGYLLNLPSKDSQRMVNTQDLIRLKLNETGDLYLGDEVLSLPGMETTLKEGIGRRPNLTVLLSINSACPWQRVVDVIGAAQRTQVENFSFKMENL